jgi:hypothetical protein
LGLLQDLIVSLKMWQGVFRAHTREKTGVLRAERWVQSPQRLYQGPCTWVGASALLLDQKGRFRDHPGKG